MPEEGARAPSTSSPRRRPRARTLEVVAIAGGLLVFAWICVAHARMWSALGESWLLDVDGYLRMARIREILAGQFPFERWTQSNPPAGETTPWTLPTDLVILALGLVLRPFFEDFDRALYVAGYWMSPVLFIPTFVLLVRSVRRLGGRKAALVFAACFPLATPVTNYDWPARPDHHSVILLATVLTAVGCLRWLTEVARARRLWPATFGEVLHTRGFGMLVFGLWLLMWTSFEGAPMLAFVLGSVAWYMVAAGPEHVRREVALGTTLLLTLVSAGLSACVVLEHGQNTDSYWIWDAFSFRHVAALLVLGTGSMFLARAAARPLPVRFGVIALVTTAALGALLVPDLLFPRPPMTKEVADFQAWIWDSTTDTAPLYWEGWAIFPKLIRAFGLPLLLAPFGAAWVIRRSRLPIDASWLLVLAVLAYTVITVRQVRWDIYALTGLLVLSSIAVARAARRLRGQVGWALGRATLLGAGALTILGGNLLTKVIETPAEAPPPWFYTSTVNLDQLRPHWEQDREARGTTGDRIIAPFWLSPRVLYEWNVSVLATPYYRNTAGMKRQLDWLASGDHPAAIAEMRAAGWEYAIVIDALPLYELDSYPRYLGQEPPKNTLYDALALSQDLSALGVDKVAELLIDEKHKVHARLIYVGGKPRRPSAP